VENGSRLFGRAPGKRAVARGHRARFGRHESTIAYWVRKYDLQAVNRERHAAHAGLTKVELESLIARDMSIAEIARAVDRSKGTVRHWLAHHGLKTRPQRDGISTRAANAGNATVIRECSRHGMTPFWLEGRGYYRCKRCRMERVSERRRKLKLLLVAEAGGRCVICGYDRCVAALHFHHVDARGKRFHLGMQGATRSLAAVRVEMAKCALLCANCHAEVEAGPVDVPATNPARSKVS
jgi:transposase